MAKIRILVTVLGRNDKTNALILRAGTPHNFDHVVGIQPNKLVELPTMMVDRIWNAKNIRPE
jgi:hypothetical protein